MRIKLVAATAPTLIKALVLTIFNILDLLSKKLGQAYQIKLGAFITRKRLRRVFALLMQFFITQCMKNPPQKNIYNDKQHYFH